MNKELIKSGYLRSIFHRDQFTKVIEQLAENIKASGVEFDTIVFRGSSGALVCPTLAMKLDKEMLLVRKADNNHSCYQLEGYVGAKRFIVVDDLICSGGTINEIFNKVRNDGNEYPIATAPCAGIFLYHHYGDKEFNQEVTYKKDDNEVKEKIPVKAFRFD